MALSIVFTEPATVNTGGALLAAGAVYDSGHSTWVYLGFRSPLNMASVQTSTDGGLTWAMHNMPSASTWRAIAYSPTLDTLVAVGNGVAAFSTDGGSTWTAAVSLPEANNWIDVTWWDAQGIFVMVAASGVHRVGTSADGQSWTMQSAAAASAWSGIQCSDTVAVAVTNSSSASTQQVMTSADGATWALQTHASIKTNRGTVSSATRHGIGYSPDLDMFLITGTDGSNITYAYRSTDDGVTWTASDTIPTLSNTTNRGYTWLAAAQSWYVSCADFHYGESADGVAFTITSLSTSHSGYTPVGWDNSGAVLIAGSTLGFDTVLRGAVTGLGAVTPSTGTRRGGTLITISGIGLSGVTQGDVTVGGSVALSVAVNAAGTAITCLTPAHAVGPVDVVITDVGTLTDAYTYVSVDRVVPDSGSAQGGESVTIRGYGFDQAAGVAFGGAVALFTYVSNTELTAITPAHASGTVDVVVAGVDTLTNGYSYTIALELLPPIPVRVPPVYGIDQLLQRDWVLWLQTAKQRIETPVTIAPEQIVGGAALTGVSDTNVTLTLTGTPASALLQAVTATLGWSGFLGVSRGGTGLGAFASGDVLYASSANRLAGLTIGAADTFLKSDGSLPAWTAGAALTRVDDTNVTLTLGGSAATALVNAASITVGWSGTLALARGGLGGDFSTIAKGGLFVGTAAAAVGIKTVGADSTVLIADAASTGGVKWDTLGSLTIPYTSVVSVPTATVLGRNTAGTGAAEALGTLPSAVQDNITRLGTLTNGPGGFTAGSIIFHNGTTLAQDNASLFWDAVNKFVGIGTNAPTVGLDIIGAGDIGRFRIVRIDGVPDYVTARTTSGGGVVSNGDGLGSFIFRGWDGATFRNAAAIQAFVDSTPGAGDMPGRIGFYTTPDGSTTIAERLRINYQGNIFIGSNVPYPTAGQSVLIFEDGLAPSGMGANTAGLYADDVGGTVEQFAINENSSPTRLTGLICRNSAQFDKTDTTLANVTGLTRNVAAGLTYRFEAVLNISADVTGGSKYAISGTATATAIWYSIELLDFATDAYTIANLQTALAGSSAQVGTTAGRCLLRGTITVNAAGTLTVQFAQSAASGTSSVLANSTFEIQQVT